MNLLFAGDWAPYKKVENVYGDHTIIYNLECAFADDEIVGYKAYESVLSTSCIDNVMPAGFASLSIANNHVYDAGPNRFDYVVDEFERRGLRYFGIYDRPLE